MTTRGTVVPGMGTRRGLRLAGVVLRCSLVIEIEGMDEIMI